MRLMQPERAFWRSTPARVAAFFEQHARAERAQDARAGLIVSAIVNTHRKKNAPTVQPSDFFPGLKPARPRAQSAEEARAIVRSYFGLNG